MMPTYSDRLVIAFPLADLELANRFAHLFDPDTGGASTFTEERQTAGYAWTETVVYDYLEGLVRSHDPAQWYPLLYALALEKGVEPPTEEDVTHLCDVILIDPDFGDQEWPIPVTPEQMEQAERNADAMWHALNELSEPG